MRGYDFSAQRSLDGARLIFSPTCEAVIICRAEEARGLVESFGWDPETIAECENLDETVRHTGYTGYDFISLLHLEAERGVLSTREVNIFYSRRCLAVVLPEDAGPRLLGLADDLIRAIPEAAKREAPLIYLYYKVFDRLASDASDTLETLEDEIEALSEAVEQKLEKEQSSGISRLRRRAHTCKKVLRALSYIGGQIREDGNDLLGERARYFRGIDTRLQKLYHFADDLFDLTNALIHSYDSKCADQMNAAVGKLTVITLFFGAVAVISGIYGMNFVHMPELDWPFGYPAALGLMAGVIAVIYIVLKKKKWL